jgi:serine/threonine-protein kinase
MSNLLERLNVAFAGRYAIEQELGRGGMATVYRAADLKHDRHVAIKVLRPDLAAAVGPERFGPRNCDRRETFPSAYLAAL